MVLEMVVMRLSYHPLWQKNGYLHSLVCSLAIILVNNLVSIADNEEGVPFGTCLHVRTMRLGFAAIVLGKVRQFHTNDLKAC